MKNVYSADFAKMPYPRCTGQEAQFKQFRSKVIQMYEGAGGGEAGQPEGSCLGACLF